MNSAYVEQCDEAQEAFAPSSALFGWHRGTAEQVGPIGELPDLSADIERQVARQERQQAAYRFEEQRRELDDLRRAFVFSDPISVGTFLREHRALPIVLLDAVPRLRDAFGTDATLQLQLMVEEDEPTILCGLVLWAGPLPSAQRALRRFDEAWWLSNCQRASGNLIFDYELR